MMSTLSKELLKECVQNQSFTTTTDVMAAMKDKILSLYACGMSQKDIAEQIKINSGHNPNVYAKQLSFKNPGVVMIELQNKSFFNKDWDVSMIQEAVNYGYNIAVSQGLNRQN